MHPQDNPGPDRPDPTVLPGDDQWSAAPTPRQPPADPTLPPTAAELVPATAAFPQPVPAYQSPVPAGSPVLTQIGETQVTASSVHTPAGSFPLRGSTWVVTDRMYPVQKIPTWAIVLAVVGFFCLTIFSLLFLLAKQTRYQGFVEVFVGNGPHQYVARIPTTDPVGLQYIHNQLTSSPP